MKPRRMGAGMVAVERMGGKSGSSMATIWAGSSRVAVRKYTTVQPMPMPMPMPMPRRTSSSARRDVCTWMPGPAGDPSRCAISSMAWRMGSSPTRRISGSCASRAPRLAARGARGHTQVATARYSLPLTSKSLAI